MTMQTSGAISIGQANAEVQQGGTTHAGDAALSKLAGVSPGQQYAWSYWYGKSFGYPITEQGFGMNGSAFSAAAIGQYGGPASTVAITSNAAAVNPYNGTFSAANPGQVDISPAGFQWNGYDPAMPGSMPQIPFSDQYGNTGYVDAIFRYNNNLHIYAKGNASMDGITLTTSLGEQFVLSIDKALTVWNPNIGTSYTVYVCANAVWMGARSYVLRLSGVGQRPRPLFYVPPVDPNAPAPGSGGGGGG